LLGLATFFGPEHDHPRRADQPSGHRQRAALAEAINDFPGAVIMVFARPLFDRSLRRSIVVVANQTVTTYDGDLDEYANGVVDR